MSRWERYVVGAAVLLGTGCAGILPGGGAAACAPGMLVAKSESGALCLDSLQQQPRIARWMAENGAPDYVEPTDAGTIRFFYIERDAVVSFESGLFASDEPSVAPRIRSADHVRFSDADRARLGRVRIEPGRPRNADEPEPGGGVRRARVGED